MGAWLTASHGVFETRSTEIDDFVEIFGFVAQIEVDFRLEVLRLHEIDDFRRSIERRFDVFE